MTTLEKLRALVAAIHGNRFQTSRLPGGGLSSAARIRGIVQHRAQVIMCTPTYALHLAEVAAREGLSLRDSAVRKIFVAGEPGGSVPAVRERISAAWNGAEVLDHYGM